VSSPAQNSWDYYSELSLALESYAFSLESYAFSLESYAFSLESYAFSLESYAFQYTTRFDKIILHMLMKIPPPAVSVISLIKNGSSIPSFIIESVIISQEPMANRKREIVFVVKICKVKSFESSFFLLCMR